MIDLDARAALMHLAIGESENSMTMASLSFDPS